MLPNFGPVELILILAIVTSDVFLQMGETATSSVTVVD